MDRNLWWSVFWWPWGVVWSVTALAVAVAWVALVVARRVDRRNRPAVEVPGLTLYLDEQAVTRIYLTGGYGDALRREVEEHEGRKRGWWLGLWARLFGGGRSSETEYKVVRKYIADNDSIVIAGKVFRALESARAVVHVDLVEGTVRRPTPDGGARLEGEKSYVSVEGKFRLAHRTGDSAVFLAPYGVPDDPEEGPQVRLDCRPKYLSDDDVPIPDDPFQARCLGKVQSWNKDTGELVIRPIAIFQ